MVWAGRISLDMAHRLPASHEGRTALVSGKVIDVYDDAWPRQLGLRLQVTAIQFSGPAPDRVPRLLRLQVFSPSTRPQAGEHWRYEVKLRRPYGVSNPGLVDPALRALGSRLDAVGTVRSATRLTGASASISHRLRHRYSTWLGEHMPALEPWLYPLLTGRDLPGDQRALLRETGTLHLFVVSGMHVSMLALLAWRLLCVCLGSGVPVSVPVAGAMGTGWMLVWLSGWGQPALRAGVFLLIWGLSVCTGRRLSAWRMWLAGMAVCLLVQPFALFMPGAWLSFVASGFLLFWLGQGRGLPGLLTGQFMLTLGLAPFVILVGGEVTPAALVANLVAVPLVTLVMLPLDMLCFLLSLLAIPPGWLEAVLGGLVKFLVGWLRLSHWMGDLTGVRLGSGGSALWLGGMAGWLLLPWPRGFRLLSTGLLCVCLLSPPRHSGVSVAVLDVGQGTAVLVRVGSYSLLYDTGPGSSGGYDAGERIVVPVLKRLGVRQLDALVVSHGDLDHAGGTASVVTAMRPELRLSGEPGRLAVSGFSPCDARQWTHENVQFRVFQAPVPVRGEKGNNHSCILYVETPEGRLMLVGDIDQRAEKALVASRQAWRAELLLAPHHGSGQSSSLAFLNAVRPSLVLVSAGYRNAFRHPADETLRRYSLLGARVFNTALSGLVEVRLRGGQARVYRHRQDSPRFWRIER
jgi:competence protein ComEC